MLPPPINHFLIECFFVNSITFNLTVFKEFLQCLRGFRIVATCYNRHQDLIAFAIFFTVAINCKWIFIFGLYIFCPQWNSLIRSMNLYTIHRLKSTIGFLQSSFRSVLDFMCSCRYDYWRMHVSYLLPLGWKGDVITFTSLLSVLNTMSPYIHFVNVFL